MSRALQLANNSNGKTLPNPLVGCVIVKNGNIIAEGSYERYGAIHAEKQAILNCKESLLGADLYVNLEPCSHYGMQPPCANLIVEHKIKNVFYSLKDPDERVRGRGIEYLNKNGVHTESGILLKEAWDLNESFLYHRITGLPFIIGKWASSIDGKLFTYTKNSQWISGELSRNHAHVLRNNVQAIMVGATTLKVDNPRLNVRNKDIQEPNNPIKIIVSSNGNINIDSDIFKNKDNKIIIATTNQISLQNEKALLNNGCNIVKTNDIAGRVDLKDLLVQLGKMNIVSVLVEGGASLLQSFITQRLINKAYIYMGGLVIGGNNNGLVNQNLYAELAEAPQFILQGTRILDNDLCIEYLYKDYYIWKDKVLCSQEL